MVKRAVFSELCASAAAEAAAATIATAAATTAQQQQQEQQKVEESRINCFYVMSLCGSSAAALSPSSQRSQSAAAAAAAAAPVVSSLCMWLSAFGASLLFIFKMTLLLRLLFVAAIALFSSFSPSLSTHLELAAPKVKTIPISAPEVPKVEISFRGLGQKKKNSSSSGQEENGGGGSEEGQLAEASGEDASGGSESSTSTTAEDVKEKTKQKGKGFMGGLKNLGRKIKGAFTGGGKKAARKAKAATGSEDNEEGTHQSDVSPHTQGGGEEETSEAQEPQSPKNKRRIPKLGLGKGKKKQRAEE
ncbi:hypothetical protein Efla_006539 [Eimeria flavescens]